MYYVAQIVGLVGLVLSLLSFQQSNRKRIMIFQMIASLSFSAQLFMLGAITGGCLDIISFVRTLIFSKNDKKWAKSPIWLFVFIAIMVITSILTWHNIYSILALAGSVLSTIAFWMKTPKNIRLVSLMVGPCWFVYNILNHAYTGAINELIAMASIVISLLRYDISKKNKEVIRSEAN